MIIGGYVPEPPLMRPRPPEVWTHLIAFVHARLAEGNTENYAQTITGLVRLVQLDDDAYAPRPEDDAIDPELILWHVAATWRGHPDFRKLLDRLYDRWYFDDPNPPDREKFVGEWKP